MAHCFRTANLLMSCTDGAVRSQVFFEQDPAFPFPGWCCDTARLNCKVSWADLDAVWHNWPFCLHVVKLTEPLVWTGVTLCFTCASKLLWTLHRSHDRLMALKILKEGLSRRGQDFAAAAPPEWHRQICTSSSP